jgi:hypothetical protein
MRKVSASGEQHAHGGNCGRSWGATPYNYAAVALNVPALVLDPRLRPPWSPAGYVRRTLGTIRVITPNDGPMPRQASSGTVGKSRWAYKDKCCSRMLDEGHNGIGVKSGSNWPPVLDDSVRGWSFPIVRPKRPAVSALSAAASSSRPHAVRAAATLAAQPRVSG